MKPNWNAFQRMWNLYRERGVPPSFSSAVVENDPQHLAFLRSMTKAVQNADSADLPLDGLEVVVVDLETSGFHSRQGDEIIAIGAVAVCGTEVRQQERFSTLVNPKRSVPAHIQALTGLTQAQLDAAPDLVLALSRFFQFVGNRPLVAHHSRHERDFLQAALWKTGRTKLAHRLIDTMLLIRLCEGPLGDASLDALCKRHQIAIGKRHDAYHDALAAARLWAIYVERALQKGFRTLREVYQEAGSW